MSMYIIILIIILICIITLYNVKIVKKLKRKENKIKNEWNNIFKCHIERNKLMLKILDIINKYNIYNEVSKEIMNILNKTFRSTTINGDIELNEKLIEKTKKLFSISKRDLNILNNKSYVNCLKKLKTINDKINDSKSDYNNAVVDYNKFITSSKGYFWSLALKKKKYLLYR